MRIILIAAGLLVTAASFGFLTELAQPEWVDSLMVLTAIVATPPVVVMLVRSLAAGRNLPVTLLVGSVVGAATGVGLILGLFLPFALYLGDREPGEWPSGEAPVLAMVIWGAAIGGILGLFAGAIVSLLNRWMPLHRREHLGG